MNYCWNNYVAGQSDMNDRRRHHKSNRSDDRSNQNFLQSLVGKNVKINRGGPESLEGKLLAVKSDYLVLSTKEGVVYISTSHVKSITELPGSNKSGHRDPSFVNAANFNGVIRSFNHEFVQINWGGPEKVEGFVAEVGNDSVLLVVGKEVVQIQLFHIKTIKAAGKNKSGGNKSGSNNNNNNNNNNKDKSNDNKNKNKTQGNRTGGNRSGKNRANAASVTPKTTRRSITKG